MKPNEFKRVARKVMSAVQASRQSDPRFFNSLNILPNPDPVLRAMGRAEIAYDAIMSDAHVIGEIRTVRAAVLGYQRRVVLADDDLADNAPEVAARDLCRQWMKQRPNAFMTWDDVVWSMATAVFYGYRPHELVWDTKGEFILPSQILDVPNRRFKFNTESMPRLLTREQQTEGIEVEPYKFIFTRHMPSYSNPYGRAVLSSCFWPYTFKHGGFKFFYEFCEFFGLPFAVGKYAPGSTPEKQNELVDALVEMLENRVAAMPDDGSVELLESKAAGNDLPTLALIALCNKEMSKAITSQTLATDIDGAGSRAAAETHQDRQDDVSESDRNIIASSFNETFEWITYFNFGPKVTAPKFEFYKETQPTKERAEIYEIAARVGRPSRKAFHEEMGIPQAEEDDDVLTAASTQPMNNDTQFSRHCPTCKTVEFNEGKTLETIASEAADSVIEIDLIEPIKAMLTEYEEQGKTLREFMTDLPRLFNVLDDRQLQNVTQQVLQYAFAEGMAEE